MLLRSIKPRTVHLFDFLAPSLLKCTCRSASSAPPRQTTTVSFQSTGADVPLVVRKLRNQTLSDGHSSIISDHAAALFNRTLSNLRRAMDAQDTLVVKQLAILLEEKNLLHLLKPPDVEQISNFMVSSFLPKDGDEWDSKVKTVVEYFAIQAAADDSTDALNACMAFHLKKNDPSAVIELYQRIPLEKVGHESELEDLTPSDSTEVDGLSSAIPEHPGRVSILLAVTAAHAMQNSFKAALDTCLTTTIRFHHFTTTEFLENLKHNPALRDKLANYVRRLNTARLVARPPSLSKHVTKLSNSESPNTKALVTLYNNIVEGLLGPDPFLAADPSLVTADKSITLTEVGWTSFLVAFLKCERRDLASKLWDDRSRWGLRPSVSMWTALLDAYDSVSATDDAVAAWDMMLNQGIKPDALVYRAIISVLFNARREKHAMDQFATFQKTCLKRVSVAQALSVYNTVLRGLLRTNHIDEANALMQEMHTKEPAPDIVSYNTFMAYFGRRTDFKGLAAVLNKMTSVNIMGDVHTFSTILSALLKVGKKDAPEVIFSIMKKHGIQPNAATFTTIIDNLMREQTEEHLQTAISILDIMEETPAMRPNEKTYTSILGGLYRGGWLDPKKVEQSRLDIVRRMKKRGVQFRLPTYHILLKGCLGYPHEDGLRIALAYYQEMREQNLPFANTTWFLLFAGLLNKGEWEMADELVKDMYKSGHQPGGTVLSLVRRIRARTRY